jgi:hypothetical protein
MSFIITVYTHEGVVMAADSRLTLNAKVGEVTNEKTISFDFSNSTNKLFCTKRGVGISTCGNADIQGKPIAGFIEHFILQNNEAYVGDVAAKLLIHFRSLQPGLKSIFHVSGYDSEGKQRIYKVNTETNSGNEINPGFLQGATWDGENDVLIRLIQPCWLSDKDGKPQQALPTFPIPWNFFSLQDAIDFASFAMSATIGTLRFQNRLKTVGGPVDLLAIKPDGIVWVQRKSLHA